MVDEQQWASEFEDETPEDESVEEEAAATPGRLSQNARRERITAVAGRLGSNAAQDGSRIVVEVGEPVVLHLELDRDGIYSATWWATQLTEHGHHRWREAVEPLLRDGEAIYTSALGGGYLVEIQRTTSDEDELVAWVDEAAPVERVRELLKAFPDAVSQLSPEPVPEYLIPPEPEDRGDAESESES